MLKAGSSVEVALGAMFASPSFNVIVLGMVLTLFPWYLAALKVAASLVMVLLVVPALSRLAERPGWRRSVETTPRLPGLRLFQWTESLMGSVSQAFLTPAGDAPKGFFHALGWVVLRYARNLWTVLRISLPLMVLAGLLGATMVELLPGPGWRSCPGRGLPNAGELVLVAVFGTLLPVPIAFDVVVCAVLWNAGVPTYVVATLLVTLALYSVYPWSLIGTTLSWRVAAVAGAAVVVLGITVGGIAGLASRWQDLQTIHRAANVLSTLPAPAPQPVQLAPGKHAAELRGLAPPVPRPTRVAAAGDLELWGAPFREPAVRAGGKPFARIEGARSVWTGSHTPSVPGDAAGPDAHRGNGGRGRERRRMAGPGGGHAPRSPALRQRGGSVRAPGGGLPGDAGVADLHRRPGGPRR
jgi:uncharacterized membrane protein YraQ (UPF0718 family)